MLEKINTPDDLKRVKIEELPKVAEEIRELIINTVSETGGHLAPSLGVVELTIALHYVFDTPKDKIIWDVGHQAYAHKILTGRKNAFHTLRQYGGLSGFPKREESRYDAFNVGHSSTSISAAIGMAQARCLKGDKSKVVAVIGDGSLMAGLALEGLNYAGHVNKDLIIILNDNEMSISPNVGALSSALSRIISGQAYNKFRDEVRVVLEKIPGIGEPVYRMLRQSEGFFKSLFVPGMIFEELGFMYIGPVFGHKTDLLIENLKNIKKLKGPILLHVITKKGKGYEHAENNPTFFHGVGPFDKKTGKTRASGKAVSYTSVFGDTLAKIAAHDPHVVAITAGMTSGTGLDKFRQEHADRFIDVGIAEQHAITFAAGMATEGYRPVAAIYSTFLQRAYDQVLHDVCMQNLPVTFVLDRAGIVGDDGPTHHGLFDISYLRPLPNLVFMSPKDENELQHMIYTAFKIQHPVAIRYPRGSGEGVKMDKALNEIPSGKAEVLRDGKDLAVFAIGSTVYPSLAAADRLQAEGIDCAVINTRFIKPLDEDILFQYASIVDRIITVEENVLQGGFGSLILEKLHSRGYCIDVLTLGLPDTFIEQGTQNLLRAKYGIDADGIYSAAMKIMKHEKECKAAS